MGRVAVVVLGAVVYPELFGGGCHFYKFPCMHAQLLLALCMLDVLVIIERTERGQRQKKRLNIAHNNATSNTLKGKALPKTSV